MLRASALFYAVTVSVLIAMVTGSMMLLVHYRNMETERWLARERSASNARSAVRWAMSSFDGSAGAIECVDLFGKRRDSVLVRMTSYGLLDRIAARAWVAGQQTDISAFTGGRAEEGNVLVLGTADAKVNLCGDARVHGDVLVPNADVERGYIEGRAFTGERLVEGGVAASSGNFPAVSQDRIRSLERYCRRYRGQQEDTVTWAIAEGEDLDATPDVFAATPVVFMGASRRLSGVSLKGPLIVRSGDSLEIASDCDLDMVIVEAPYIKIKAGASLTVQCFAETGINVEEHASLLYPSVLALMPQGGPENSATINIGPDAILEGSIVALRDLGKGDQAVGVNIAPGALVRGVVYAQGAVQHQGTIHGRLCAEGLILRTSSSTYRGYLLDGVLDGFEDSYRPEWMGLGKDEHKDVIEWTPTVHRVRAL